jgi:anti-sigma factor RsiW
VYLDGTITAPQMRQLNAILLDDADARRQFAEVLNLDSALAAMAAGWPVAEATPQTHASPFTTILHRKGSVRI